MIYVDLQGGLGNQLFQYAAARYLSIKNNDEEIFFTNAYYSYVKNRRLLLTAFNTKGKVAHLKDYPLLFTTTLPFIDQYTSFVYNKFFSSSCVIYNEKKHYAFDPLLEKQMKCVFLKGFWQSREYAESIRDVLQKELVLKKPLSLKAKSIHQKMQNKNSVSIHVRRGDYVNNQSFPICTLEYYLDAIQVISKKVRHPNFFIFSDDPLWVKENLLHIPNTTIVSGLSDELEDFFLMSHTNHAIIANSTFSWWAAWLGKQKNQVVIAPDPWLSEREDTRELFLDNWIKLKRI